MRTSTLSTPRPREGRMYAAWRSTSILVVWCHYGATTRLLRTGADTMMWVMNTRQLSLGWLFLTQSSSRLERLMGKSMDFIKAQDHPGCPRSCERYWSAVKLEHGRPLPGYITRNDYDRFITSKTAEGKANRCTVHAIAFSHLHTTRRTVNHDVRNDGV